MRRKYPDIGAEPEFPTQPLASLTLLSKGTGKAGDWGDRVAGCDGGADMRVQ